MGLLHVYGEIPANENRCFIELTNPLLDTKQPYTLKLLKVYSHPNVNLEQDIEITIKVNDTPFFVPTTFDYVDDTDTIEAATIALANKLDDGRFKRSLETYQQNIPKFEINANNTDVDLNTRILKLSTSRNTFLFSNNKYYLYMLGYNDNDFEEINVSDIDDVFLQNQIQTSNVDNLETADCSTIYVVKYTVNSPQVRKIRDGGIKWFKTDKFKDVFFQSKRHGRIVQGGRRRLKRSLRPIQPPRIKRQRRHLGKPEYSVSELSQTIIKDSDTKEIKHRKIAKQGHWDLRVGKLHISWANPNDPRIKENEIKLNRKKYWRDKIVTALSTNSERNKTIYVPRAYIDESDKDKDKYFIVPLLELTDNDETYVKLAAVKLLSIFYPFVIANLREINAGVTYSVKIQRLQEELKNITALENVLTDSAATKHFKDSHDVEQGTYTTSSTANLPHNDPSDSSSNVDDDPATEDAEKIKEEEIAKLQLEISNLQFDPPPLPEGCCSTDDIDEIVDELQKQQNILSDARISMNENVENGEGKLLLLETNVQNTIDNFNEYLTNVPILVVSGVTDDMLKKINEDYFTEKAEPIQSTAYKHQQSIDTNVTEGMTILNKQIDKEGDFYLDYLTDLYEKGNTPNVIKEKILENLPTITDYVNTIKRDTDSILTNQIILKGIKADADKHILDINELMVRLNSLYNRLKQGLPVTYPNTIQSNSLGQWMENEAAAAEAVSGMEYEGAADDEVAADAAAKAADAADFDFDISDEGEGEGEEAVEEEEEEGEGEGEEAAEEEEEEEGEGEEVVEEEEEGEDGDEGAQSSDESGGGEGEPEEVDEEKDAREFDMNTRKNVIGFIHKRNYDFYYKFILEKFTQAMNAETVGKAIKTEINRVVPSLCNIKYKLDKDEGNTEDDIIALKQITPGRNMNSDASIHISFNNIQDAMFLRFDEVITNSSSEEIVLTVGNPEKSKIVSKHYGQHNPWDDSFAKRLPLNTVPVNAGSETNAFLSNLGITSSLGIIEKTGTVFHPVNMVMPAGQKHAFYIYFYSQFNTPVMFEYPSFLYFHFEIEPMHSETV